MSLWVVTQLRKMFANTFVKKKNLPLEFLYWNRSICEQNSYFCWFFAQFCTNLCFWVSETTPGTCEWSRSSGKCLQTLLWEKKLHPLEFLYCNRSICEQFCNFCSILWFWVSETTPGTCKWSHSSGKRLQTLLWKKTSPGWVFELQQSWFTLLSYYTCNSV